MRDLTQVEKNNVAAGYGEVVAVLGLAALTVGIISYYANPCQKVVTPFINRVPVLDPMTGDLLGYQETPYEKTEWVCR